nr:hydroxymethylbilane synthase [Methanothrix sp.]
MGTRGSPLALRQTEIVAKRLIEHGAEAEIVTVRTSGDLFLDRPLHMISGQGLFVREIDERMLSGEIDLAVHSMKDLPSKRPERLRIAAIMKRDSPCDILLTKDGSGLDDLKSGAVIGTSSMRRAAQLRRARPDLVVRSLRGNLQTRLRKLHAGEYDGIVIAEAGVQRMGYHLGYKVLDPGFFVPSPNQGTIAVVSVAGTEGDALASLIDHRPSREETMVERRIMEVVGGGCLVPMAVFARHLGDRIHVTAEILSKDGERFVRLEDTVPRDGLESAERIGRRLLEMGGDELVREAVEIER